MPYRPTPSGLRPSTESLALVELWQRDAETDSLPVEDELALWWVERCPERDDDRQLPVAGLRRAWRRLARHVHLWTFHHAPEVIDLVGMELGIEGDWIPEPKLTFDREGRLQALNWEAPRHLYARPPLGFVSWQLPLACVGYERPAWREAPLRGLPPGGVARLTGSWWC